MDTIKIQTEAMKALQKKQTVRWYNTGDVVYLLFSYYTIFAIPKRECYLNLTGESGEGLRRIVDDALENKIAAQWKGSIKVLNDGVKALQLEPADVTLTDAPYVYVDEKPLKYFGNAKGLRFTVKNKVSPVAVYNANSGAFLGVIAPIRMEEANE